MAEARMITDEQIAQMGATWHRVDLHLHTPGVASFSCPDGADIKSATGKDLLVTRYVDQLANQGISVCAITDYNGVRTDWFEPIRDAAAERGIKVLPGAEISFATPKYGLHVLAIFPESVTPAEINSFLQALDRDPATPLVLGSGKHRDIELADISEQGALKRVRDRFRCLLILPHPDADNGLLKSFRTADAASFLTQVAPDAIEHCSPGEIRKLLNQQTLGSQFFANLAQVEFSDPKRIEEIGEKRRQDGKPRATYIKLSATDIDALRLALHDPSTRISTGAITRATHPRLRRVEISGSGFLGNLTIAWNDDLNVLIGGRGTGKSAIIETLRYALEMEPYSEESYRHELVHYALGSGGKVTVVVERPVGNGETRAYRVERIWGENPRVFELGTDEIVGVSPAYLFGPSGPPTIFGQREIYAIAGSEEYRLELLDELIGEDAREHAKLVNEAAEGLRANSRAIVEAKTRLAKREEHRQRLKTIEHELSIYEKHGVAEKLAVATALRSDRQYLRAAIEAVERIRRSWLENQDDILSPLTTATRSLRKGRSLQKAILNEGAEILDSLAHGLRDLSDRGQDLLKSTAESLARLDQRWQEELRPIEDELNKIKQEARAEALDPDRLLRLSEEKAVVVPIIEEMDRSESQLTSLREQRARLTDTVRERRHREHQLRRGRASEIESLLDGRLRLIVEFKGQKEDFRKRLLALLKGSGVSADAVERLAAPDAADGLSLSEVVSSGATQVQDRYGLTMTMAERLVKWLTDDESRLFELETIIPGDALRVDLVVNGTTRPLDRLSPGQRATAILLLLFALPDRIMILDQPEDDLDNRFVYEDIVQILREYKGIIKDGSRRRQIITATHNPNIPVLGDAELVLALEAHDGRARIIGQASIDDKYIRELIKSIMEGGEEAFLRRAAKYGGL